MKPVLLLLLVLSLAIVAPAQVTTGGTSGGAAGASGTGQAGTGNVAGSGVTGQAANTPAANQTQPTTPGQVAPASAGSPGQPGSVSNIQGTASPNANTGNSTGTGTNNFGGTLNTPVVNSGDPSLVTPSAVFISPGPTAGVSASGRAGISNRPEAAQFVPPSGQIEGARFDQTGVGYTVPGNSPAIAGEAAPTLLMLDTGSQSFISGAAGTPGIAQAPAAAQTMSLGEVAARFRMQKSGGTQNASSRVITNQDIARMNGGEQQSAPGAQPDDGPTHEGHADADNAAADSDRANTEEPRPRPRRKR